MLELVKERAEALFSKSNNSRKETNTLGGYCNPCERKMKDAKTDTESKKEVVGLATCLRSRLKKKKKKKKSCRWRPFSRNPVCYTQNTIFTNDFEENR